MHCHDGETNPLNPTFHIVFFVPSPASYTVRCLCCNVGLCFSLWNKFFMWQVHACLKSKWACCLHFGKLVLPFLGVQILGCSTETAVAWFLVCTRKPTFDYHLWSSLKGILGLFQICLEVHGACCHCSPFDSHSGGGTLVLWQSKQCSGSPSEWSELIHMKYSVC